MTEQVRAGSKEAADCSLDPSAAEVCRWGNAAVAAIAQYLETIREQRVYPQTTARQIRDKLGNGLSEDGIDFGQLLDVFNNVIIPASRQNAHPRMFGYVQAPGTAIAAIADLLASGLNANLTAWRSAPAAVELERITIDWIKQIMGVEEGAGGVFVSGGSMANFAALATARRVKAGPDLTTKGAQFLSQPMRLYISAETHHSVAKAAVLLGIGKENVRIIRVDDRLKIRLDDLAASINEDIAAGHEPFCVVANAGAVGTGAFDSLAEVADLARRFNLWMHVDASYGGFAALTNVGKHLFRGLSRADSVALDPHKWLYLPVDCGCVLYRDPEAARSTFGYEAEYTRVLDQQSDEAFAFWDYTPELSRRFRALKVWMVLKGVGLRSLAQVIEKDLACARYLEKLVRASEDFEMLAPVELSIFCFRYVPSALRDGLKDGDEVRRRQIDQQLNELNERLLIALQLDGSSYLSNVRLDGRFALRGCVMNYRTTERDMEILLEDLRRVAKSL
jgi:glutamate/tyrosine decarboxylase-like PLP-dependent enzyme